MYRLVTKGEVHLIQLQNVAKISLQGHILEIAYACTRQNGLFFWGSGAIMSQQLKDVFHYDTEYDAQMEFKSIQKAAVTRPL